MTELGAESGLEERLLTLEGRQPAAGQAPIPITREALRAAYRRAVADSGLSDVLVSDIARGLPCAPLEGVKGLLLTECREGRAVRSLGDWSLSGEETRGRRHPHPLLDARGGRSTNC